MFTRCPCPQQLAFPAVSSVVYLDAGTGTATSGHFLNWTRVKLATTRSPTTERDTRRVGGAGGEATVVFDQVRKALSGVYANTLGQQNIQLHSPVFVSDDGVWSGGGSCVALATPTRNPPPLPGSRTRKHAANTPTHTHTGNLLHGVLPAPASGGGRQGGADTQPENRWAAGVALVSSAPGRAPHRGIP